MTLQVVAGFLGQAGIQHPANLYRNLVGALGGKRSGFFRYNDFLLGPSGSGMTMNVGPGDAIIMGTEAVSTQGGYYVWNNAQEAFSWPAAVSLPRVDSLILRVIDTDYGADPAGSKATWEVVSGTPAASPTPVADSAFAPAGAFYHPGAWLRIADLTLGASITNLASATISHKRKYARLGRRTLCLAADLPSDAQQGDVATLLDGTTPNLSLTYNGSAWVVPESVIPWITFPFAGGFVDGSSLSNEPAAGYRIVGNMVEFRGSVKNSGGTNIATGSNFTIGTMPVGARPTATTGHLSVGIAQFGTSNPPLARREVLSSGVVQLNVFNTATWASLDGMSYYLS